MSDSGRQGSQTVQAYATTAVGSLLTMSCMNLLPADLVQYGVVSSSLVTPFLAMYFVRIYLGVNEPAELTRYKSRLLKDMRQQAKILKSNGLSAAAKRDIQRKYDATVLKLSTANQDFSHGTIVIETQDERL